MSEKEFIIRDEKGEKIASVDGIVLDLVHSKINIMALKDMAEWCDFKDYAVNLWELLSRTMQIMAHLSLNGKFDDIELAGMVPYPDHIHAVTVLAKHLNDLENLKALEVPNYYGKLKTNIDELKAQLVAQEED